MISHLQRTTVFPKRELLVKSRRTADIYSNPSDVEKKADIGICPEFPEG